MESFQTLDKVGTVQRVVAQHQQVVHKEHPSSVHALHQFPVENCVVKQLAVEPQVHGDHSWKRMIASRLAIHEDTAAAILQAR
jgi:hypothetical protein